MGIQETHLEHGRWPKKFQMVPPEVKTLTKSTKQTINSFSRVLFSSQGYIGEIVDKVRTTREQLLFNPLLNKIDVSSDV